MPFKIVIGVVLTTAFALLTHAVETNWNVEDGYWNVNANWDSGNPASGDHTYNINNGGTARINSTIKLNVTRVNIGSTVDGSGHVVVEDGGTLDIGISAFRIGNIGYGELTVENGGKFISSNTLYFAHGVGSEAKVTVNGSGFSDNFEWLMMSGALHVGNAGKAEFVLNDASAQIPNYLRLGTEATGEGTMTMNGDSYVTISQLVIGTKGTGTFNVNGNSKVEVGNMTQIGNENGGVGTLILSDSATFTNTNSLFVGNAGKGYLTIQGDASLRTRDTSVGNSGNGVITVKGNGTLYTGSLSVKGRVRGDSSLTVDGNGKIIATGALSLSSSSTMDILDNGYVSNTNGTVADGSTVTVSGSGAKWENNGYIYLGSTGTGTSLLIENGGTVKNGAGYIGVYANSESSVTVKGASSLWENSSSLVVGYLGKGSLTIEDGTVKNGMAAIGNNDGGTGEVSISGSGSWQNDGFLRVGDGGAGTLTLKDTASVSAEEFRLGYSSTGSGTLNIMSDRVKITGVDGSSPVEISGGAGKGSINFNHSGTLRFLNSITGNVSVIHSGSGKTILDGANTYSGETIIYDGTLVAGHAGAFGTGKLTIVGGTLTMNSGAEGGPLAGSASALGVDCIQVMDVHDFSMMGGNLEIDILSLDSFDSILSGGGNITLSNGILMLNGFEGFEGDLDGSGNSYRIFEGFSHLSEHNLQIANYDTANWVADINSEGYLYFVRAAIPEPSTGVLWLTAFSLFAFRRMKN